MKQIKPSILGSLGAAVAIAGMQSVKTSAQELAKAAEGLSAQTHVTAEAFQRLAASIALKPDFRAEKSRKYNRFKMERGVAAIHRDLKRQDDYLRRRKKAGRNTPAVFGFPAPQA